MSFQQEKEALRNAVTAYNDMLKHDYNGVSASNSSCVNVNHVAATSAITCLAQQVQNAATMPFPGVI